MTQKQKRRLENTKTWKIDEGSIGHQQLCAQKLKIEDRYQVVPSQIHD